MTRIVKVSIAIVCLGIIVIVPFGAVSSQAQQETKPKITGPAAAGLLEKYATRAESLEAFTRTIRQQALLGAAKELRAGKALPYTTKIELEVTITSFEPEPWPPRSELPPKGSGINVCWEMSSGVSSWIGCEARKVIPVFPRPILIRTCDDIWQDLREATTIEDMRRYFNELVQRGCIVIPLIPIRNLP